MRLLGVADTRFDFALTLRISHRAWESDRATVLEQIAIQRIESGIVEVAREHAFAQVIEHHYASCPTQPAKRLLVQPGRR